MRENRQYYEFNRFKDTDSLVKSDKVVPDKNYGRQGQEKQNFIKIMKNINDVVKCIPNCCYEDVEAIGLGEVWEI